MKIKTKVYALLVIGSLLMALVGGVMFFADKDITADRQTIQVTEQLMRSATELRLLGFETILLHEERTADQWQRKMRSIHLELQALELSQPAARSTLERMRKNIESANLIHAELLLKSALTTNATPANAANEAAFAARTFAALTLVIQDVIDSTEEFNRASRRELEQTLRKVSISVAVMLVAMLAQLAFMWRLTRGSILRPLTTFVGATQRVGAGDYTFRLNFTQQDEIGVLGRCFDEMNAQVQEMNETLRQREENISVTLNSIGDAVIATDAQGCITRMNPVAERLTAWPLAEALGQPLTKVFHIISAETRLPSVNPVQLVMQHGKVVGLANHTALLARDGNEYQIADSAAPIRDATDAIVGVVLVFSDVTEKYRVVGALHDSEQRFRAILEAASVPMAVNDLAENIIYLNAAFTATFGYTLEDIPTLADWWPKAYPDPAYRQQVAERWQVELGRSAQTRTAFAPMELTIRCKDGTKRIALTSAAPLEDAFAGTHLVVLHDITDRKQADEALRGAKEHLQTTLNAIPDLLFEVDASGRVLSYHAHRSDLLAAPPEVFMGKSFADVLPPAATEVCMNALRDAATKGWATGATYSLPLPQGETWFELSVAAMPIVAGVTPRFILLTRDITERIQTKQALQSSLREITALLLEVHHRVKNNLQVITSLLRLESYRTVHDETKTVLKDMQGRIRAMALLHETIYRKGNFAAIDLGSYISQIAGESIRNLQITPGAVQLRLDVGAMQVGLDQATPCGLMISEMISNCLKHGFPDGRQGEIDISLQPFGEGEANQWRLKVSDTGVGLAADFETKRQKSLGLQLVGDLAKQMGGTLHIGNGPEAVFSVNFTAEVPTPIQINLATENGHDGK